MYYYIIGFKRPMGKQNGKCIYTNIELKLPRSGYTPKLTEYASLDRIDSSKGYIPGNI